MSERAEHAKRLYERYMAGDEQAGDELTAMLVDERDDCVEQSIWPEAEARSPCAHAAASCLEIQDSDVAIGLIEKHDAEGDDD